MSTAELKLELIRQIDSLNGEQLIHVYHYLQNHMDADNADDWDETDPLIQAKINQGIEDIANGDVYSIESVVNEVKTRYGLK